MKITLGLTNITFQKDCLSHKITKILNIDGLSACAISSGDAGASYSYYSSSIALPCLLAGATAQENRHQCLKVIVPFLTGEGVIILFWRRIEF